MLYDVETRSQIAREYMKALRADVGPAHSGRRRTRAWLAGRLLAAGRRLEADPRPQPSVRVS